MGVFEGIRLAVTRQLLINGRFLGGGQTAVNIVAHALTDTLCAHNNGWDVTVVIPPNIEKNSIPKDWHTRVVGTRTGILWEQLDLPTVRHEGVIAGFFNSLPMRGRGYVTMLHDAHVFNARQSYRPATRMWRRALSRQAGRAGNHVLTVSDHSRTDLLFHRIGKPETVGTIPNGPGPVARMCPDTSILVRHNLRADTPYCIALSSLLPHKNIGVLLKAFAAPELTGVKLVLFGTADRTAFEKEGHVVPPNVVFTGFVRDAELSALYRNTCAVCIPSTAEGFGLPALEAMTVGRPTIIAPCGALPEVVGDTGLRADPQKPTDWTTAIVRLLADTKLQGKIAQSGKARSSLFTWDAARRAVLGHLDRWYPV